MSKIEEYDFGGCSVSGRIGNLPTLVPTRLRSLSKGEISLPDAIGKEISKIVELEESKTEVVYDEEFRNQAHGTLGTFMHEVKIFFKDGTWIRISK